MPNSVFFFQFLAPEECTNGLKICGDERNKYPQTQINEVLNNLDGFFDNFDGSAIEQRFFDRLKLSTINYQNEIPENLACQTRTELLPRFARAQNINQEWAYLVELGTQGRQKIEVVTCVQAEQPCTNDLDSPLGTGKTFCKQQYRYEKLLAINQNGTAVVDTFEIPSGCVCHTKTVNLFSLRKGGFFFGFGAEPKETCDEADNEPTDLTQLNFGQGEHEDTKIMNFTEILVPCNDSLCDSEEDDTYPISDIEVLLNKTFMAKSQFNGIFGQGQPCVPKSEPKVSLRTPLDIEENPLCQARQDHIFPKKGQNAKGEWKFIINTEDYKQGISINKCLESNEQAPCKYNGEPGFYPNATVCHQLYTRHDFLALSENGRIEYDSFKVPSACVCKILDVSIFE